MNKAHYIIPIFVPHEGCPHDCVFCNQNSITGSDAIVDALYVSNTVEEYLKTIPKDNSIIEISFFGGTFTAININKQKELLAVATEYKKQNKIDFIRLSTRPDYIDEFILDNLKAYSVDIIELGVQSLDSEVLLKSARGHSEEDVVLASKLIKEYGFTLGHQIMVGLPGDNFEKDITTARKSIIMKPDMCRIYPSLVVKDTPMEKMYEMKIYNPYSLDEAVEISKILYGMYEANDIRVIRIGLQPTEEIREGVDVIAGPFHPAFRELVEGSIFRDIILDKAYKYQNKDITITVNGKDISKLYASKKKFFNDIIEQLKTINIKVIQDGSVERGEILMNFGDTCEKVSIYEYLIKKYKEGYLNNL